MCNNTVIYSNFSNIINSIICINLNLLKYNSKYFMNCNSKKKIAEKGKSKNFRCNKII